MSEIETLHNFIAKRIRYIRKLKGYTQEELSEKAQLGLKYVNHIENETYHIKLQTLEKVITALDVSLEEFFTFDEVDTKEHDTKLDKLNYRLKGLSDKDREKYLDFFLHTMDIFK